LRKGQILRLTDIDGGANVSMMMLNPHEKSERLNLPDTLKGQHTARLTAGHCFYSDMGRVLAGIVADSCGWHDPFGGVLNAEETHDKYGAGRYQELRNGFYRNGVDNLLVEMGKWDLGLEDLLMVVNFFSKVTVDDEGAFSLSPATAAPGITLNCLPRWTSCWCSPRCRIPRIRPPSMPPSGAAELVSGRR
jgi:urea carboxylase-associated protein 2